MTLMGNKVSAGILEDNGHRFCGKAIPEEIINHIFLYVPTKDLVRSATRVCKYWHYLLTEYHFWFTKVQVEGYRLPEAAKERLLKETNEAKVLRVLQRICGCYIPLNVNLILNPSGKDGFEHWEVMHGGDGMVVEDHPIGSDLIPEEADLPTQHCFVTSYRTCVRSQVVNLEYIGLDPWSIDILKPELHISEWVSARFDCHSENAIEVKLEGTESMGLVKNRWSSDTNDVICCKWYQVKEVAVDYPRGLRKITYTNGGKDRQFWAGHYGAKTAGSTVKFVL